MEITVDGGEVAPESAPEEPAPMPAPEVKSPFVDVPADYQFFKEILWMKDKGISTDWKEDNTFRPHNQTDRGTMAAFFYRLAAPKDYVAPKESPFKDVPTTHQFYTEIS